MLPDGRRVCNKCKTPKRLNEFDKRTANVDGLDTLCKMCAAERQKDYYRKSNGSYRVVSYKRRILRLHGMTIADYDRLLESQGGGCAICKAKKPGAGKIMMIVDHCHQTKKVRGLLCHKCNVGLGNFEDRKDLLMTAISYLEGSF